MYCACVDVLCQLVAKHFPPLNVSSLKVPEEFLRNCFEKMRRVWENLVAFKEGESEEETAENVDGFQQQVVELTRCLCLLKEYAAEMDKHYVDERGYPPHGKYVSCIGSHFVVTSYDIT